MSDASGGVSVEAHQDAKLRMQQAGAIPMTWQAVMAELAPDNTSEVGERIVRALVAQGAAALGPTRRGRAPPPSAVRSTEWWRRSGDGGRGPISWTCRRRCGRGSCTTRLTAHYMAARTFLPLVRAGGSYVMVNGAGALRPVPKAGPVTIVASAQLTMRDVLAAEQRGRDVRVNTVLLGTPVRTRSRPEGGADWLTADDAGAVIVRLASRSTGTGETITLTGHAQAQGFR